MKCIRFLMLFLALFLLPTIACSAQVIIPTGGLGYTCSDTLGEPKTCTCNGAADCWWMGKSGVCGSVVVLSCDLPPSQTCSCEWKKKTTNPRGRFIQLQDGFLLIEAR